MSTLAPGNYPATVRGKNNTIGIALVEVYALNHRGKISRATFQVAIEPEKLDLEAL